MLSTDVVVQLAIPHYAKAAGELLTGYYRFPNPIVWVRHLCKASLAMDAVFLAAVVTMTAKKRIHGVTVLSFSLAVFLTAKGILTAIGLAMPVADMVMFGN